MMNDPWECTRNRTARVGRRRSRVSHRQASDSESHLIQPRLALPTQLALFLTMSLVASTSVLRRQILHSRAFVPSRGVHDYKVCAHMRNYVPSLIFGLLAHSFQL